MSVADDFDAALAALTRIVVGRESLEQSLQRITDLACNHVAGADSVSVTVLKDDGRPRTAACTDGMALEIDLAQYESDRGPCLDACRRGTMVRVDSVIASDQWPEFEMTALHQGIRSSLSIPLLVDDGAVGAVNVYAAVEHAWTARSEDTGSRLAAQAAIAVANVVMYHEAMETARNLQRAVEGRDLIGQAKGILMERHKITAAQAFEMLRDVSQRRNVKLRDVAQTITETGSLPTPCGR
jgi:GAF domain-containing protein